MPLSAAQILERDNQLQHDAAGFGWGSWINDVRASQRYPYRSLRMRTQQIIRNGAPLVRAALTRGDLATAELILMTGEALFGTLRNVDRERGNLTWVDHLEASLTSISTTVQRGANAAVDAAASTASSFGSGFGIVLVAALAFLFLGRRGK